MIIQTNVSQTLWLGFKVQNQCELNPSLWQIYLTTSIKRCDQFLITFIYPWISCQTLQYHNKQKFYIEHYDRFHLHQRCSYISSPNKSNPKVGTDIKTKPPMNENLKIYQNYHYGIWILRLWNEDPRRYDNTITPTTTMIMGPYCIPPILYKRDFWIRE